MHHVHNHEMFLVSVFRSRFVCTLYTAYCLHTTLPIYDYIQQLSTQIVKKYHHHLYNVYNTRYPGAIAVGSNDIIDYSKKLKLVKLCCHCYLLLLDV